jgi:glycosyltransferase involved in cell wall biosynthesis
MKIGILIPHIFMQDALLPQVIFSPGRLAIGLADGLAEMGHEVTLFTPGAVNTKARNHAADLSYFEEELRNRGYGYIELLKKHPLTFISLSRQVQSELIADAIDLANAGKLDLLHLYTNEEDVGLPFLRYCQKPVVLTHHDPFNFSSQYRTVFPKYKDYDWLSISLAQRAAMPSGTRWLANIYHGIAADRFELNLKPTGNYIAFSGRIIESKGVHLAISAIKKFNKSAAAGHRFSLRIAGKHYSAGKKDAYWNTHILPQIDNKTIFYDGFIKSDDKLQDFLGNARALVVPSIFEEPFGLVMPEALACGTPIIGLDTGAIPEVVHDGRTGHVIHLTRHPVPGAKQIIDEDETVSALAGALMKIQQIDRAACRADFEARFTLERMCREHAEAYHKLTGLPAAP